MLSSALWDCDKTPKESVDEGKTESGPWFQSLQPLGLLFMDLWQGWTLVQKAVGEK